MSPSWGFGAVSHTRSMNTTPGSPVFQADSTISFQISCAGTVSTTSLIGPSPLSRGLTSSHLASSSTAFIKASVIWTEMLKFCRASSPSLQWMNSRDVRVAVPELSHVGSQPEGALCECGAHGRVEFHDGDGAACMPVSGRYHISLRPQLREAEPDAAAPFLDHRGVVRDLHDRLHFVSGRDDEAGGQAAPAGPGVDRA